MNNSETELYFPLRYIPALRLSRGEEWQAFIDDLSSNGSSAIQRIGFVYLMVKLCGCSACNSDSFRAMKGCAQCAHQAVKRYRGSDAELIHQHSNLCNEIDEFLAKVNQSKGNSYE